MVSTGIHASAQPYSSISCPVFGFIPLICVNIAHVICAQSSFMNGHQVPGLNCISSVLCSNNHVHILHGEIHRGACERVVVGIHREQVIVASHRQAVGVAT